MMSGCPDDPREIMAINLGGKQKGYAVYDDGHMGILIKPRNSTKLATRQDR
jgi:hypothetical protein